MRRIVTVVTVVGAVFFALGGPLINHAAQAAENVLQVLIDSHAEQEALLHAVSPEVDAKIEQAKQLAERNQYVEAAGIYQQVAAMAANLSHLGREQWAWVEAGICHDLAGQTDNAINSFNAVVSKSATSWWAEEALCRKAELCVRKGRSEDAGRTAEFLRIGFVNSTFMDRAIEIKGQIDGIGSGQVEAAIVKEHEAAEKLHALKTNPTAPLADKDILAVALQIEKDYPNTSAAVAVLAEKGKALIGLQHYDKAYEAYTQLQTRVSVVAPRSYLAIEATKGESYAILRRGQDLLEKVKTKKEGLPVGVLDKARSDLNRVVEMKKDETHVALAHQLLAEACLTSRGFGEAEAMLDKLLAEDYAAPAKLQLIPSRILSFHLLLSEAARQQGKYEKAFQVSERIKALYSGLPKKKQDSPNNKQIVDYAYVQCFMVLVSQKADHDKIEAAGQEVLSRLPGSPYADLVRMRLERPTSKPSP